MAAAISSRNKYNKKKTTQSGKSNVVGRKMEDGLLHADLVAWPSVRFFRESHKHYKEGESRKLPPTKKSQILTLFKVVDIWRAISKVIHIQLCKGKGTKIDGMGIFTLDVYKDPAFFPDHLFRKCYNIIGHKQPIKSSNLIQGIQFVQVGKVTKGGATRDEIEKVLEIVALGIRWALDRDVPSLMLQVGHIGEFVIGEGADGNGLYVGVRFGQEFTSNVKDSQTSKPQPSLGLQMEKRRLKIETQNKFEKSNLEALGVLDLSAGQRKGAGGGADGGNALIIEGKQAQKYLRKKLFERHGMYAVRDCRQILQVMDDSGDGEVNREELKHGFRGLGITLNAKMMEPLFQSMDRDGSGTLGINELYLGLRGKMDKHRYKIVNKCFDDLMKRAGRSANVRDDAVPIEFLHSEFNCDHFPDVQSGELKFDDEREKFMGQLDNQMVPCPKGFINRASFIDMYEDLNGSFTTDSAGDDLFNFMIRSTWNYWDMRGFESGQKENTKVMKKDLRNDFENDDCDEQRSVDDFSPRSKHSSSSHLRSHGGGDSRSVSSQGSYSTADSRLSRQHLKNSSSKQQHNNPNASKLKATSLSLDPIPWECNEAWTHQEMRSSIAAQPNLQRTTANQMKEKGRGIVDLSVNGLPADVFGNLNVLLDPTCLTWTVPYLPPHDHWNKLRILFFNPPSSFDQFCRTLEVNLVEEEPPITASVLASIIYEEGKKYKIFTDPSIGDVGDRKWSTRKAKQIVDALFTEAKRSTWQGDSTNIYEEDSHGKNEDDDGSASMHSFISRSSHQSNYSHATGRSSRSGRRDKGCSGGIPVVTMKSSGALPLRWIFQKLKELYGEGTSAGKKDKSATVLERVRQLILKKTGVFGLSTLKFQLNVMDEDRSLSLDKEELKQGLAKLGIILNIREIEEIFFEFDEDRSNEIEYEEFMNGIKGPISSYRKKLVKKAWKHLSNQQPYISAHDLLQELDCEWFPSVNGQMSTTSITTENNGSHRLDVRDIEEAFKLRFQDIQKITFDDFLEFHHDLSAVIRGDRIYETILRNIWHLC